MGMDAALVLNFDRALSLVSANDFVERILVRGLRAGTILGGSENFWFGHRGAGDVRLLEERGKQDGRFKVEIVPPVEVAGQMVLPEHGDSRRGRERRRCRGDSAAGAGVFADWRNSPWRRAAADDSLPHAESRARAGAFAEAKGVYATLTQ